MNKAEFYKLMKTVPKAELHIHEEAVIGSGTIKKLYRNSSGKPMSDEELDELFAYTDLAGFLKSFIKIQGMLVRAEDLGYILNDVRRYLKTNNIVYCESFFSPTTPLRKGFDYSEMMSIISRAIEKIQAEDGRTVRILVDVSRSFGPENAQRNLDLVLQEKNPYVIGIGLGGDEEKGPARDYQQVFENAVKAGLHVVAHAGETCESWSMKDSINLLHVERIGHGITAAYDEAFMKELAERRFPLEVCPTSNTFTQKYVKRLEEHPAKQLYDAGIPITINTDDPVFFKVSLIDEYWNLYSKLGFSLQDIKQVVLNGFNTAFITDEQKRSYCAAVEEAWEGWFRANPGKGS